MRRAPIVRTRGLLLGLALALALPAAPLPAAEGGEGGEGAAEDPIRARPFPVRYRPLTDAAELVRAVLSDDGEVSLQRRQEILVVVDRLSVLDRVASLLEAFDLPPRDVEVTLTLFLGTDRQREEAGRSAARTEVSREVRGVMESLSEFTKWVSYEPLGSRSVQAVEGSRVTAQLNENYRVIFEIDAVHETQDRIEFKSFSLQRVVPLADGSQRYEDMVSADVELTSGVLKLVGAASGPDSNKALFLTLQARPRPR